MKDSLSWWIGEDLPKLFAYALNFPSTDLCAGVCGQALGWDACGVGPWWYPQILLSQGTKHLHSGVIHSSHVKAVSTIMVLSAPDTNYHKAVSKLDWVRRRRKEFIWLGLKYTNDSRALQSTFLSSRRTSEAAWCIWAGVCERNYVWGRKGYRSSGTTARGRNS